MTERASGKLKRGRKRTKIAFLGEDYWIHHLADGLNSRFADELHAKALTWRPNERDKRAIITALLTADITVRVGYPLDFAWKIDRLWSAATHFRPGLKGSFFWIGTDVVNYARRLESGEATCPEISAMRRSRHMAGANHLAAEVASLGFATVSTPMPPPALMVPSAAPPLPRDFTVLSYVPDFRFEFYDGPSLLNAARSLPDVRFNIVTGTGSAVAEVPRNMRFLGRVEHIAKQYTEASVVVRSVEHDAIGATVMEGLFFGRHVLYSYELPHTVKVQHGNAAALIDALKTLKAQHDAGQLRPNTVGREWALKEFDPEPRFERIKNVLLGQNVEPR